MKHLAIIFVFFISANFAHSQIAPNFIITDSDSIEHNLYEDYLDSGKIVVIDMFFVACPICKPFNNPMQALYEEFGEGNEDVEFFLLTNKTWDSNEEVADYKVEYGLTYPGAGDDGGGYTATRPYAEGDFGTYFGAPTFIVIEPNKTLHLDLSANSVEATIAKVRERIIQIQNGETTAEKTTNVSIDISHYKELPLPTYTVKLRSGNNPDSSYVVPLSFTYPGPLYPKLSAPEIVIEIDERSNTDVTTLDLVSIQRYILGTKPLDHIQQIAADVNGSGVLTPADLISMRKVILHVQEGFSVGKSYVSLNSECIDNKENCVEAIKLNTDLEEQSISFKVIKYGDIR